VTTLGALRGPGLARRIGTWLSLFALGLQLGLLVVQAPMALGAAPTLSLPLCHARTAGDHAPAAPDKVALCPLCLGVAQASAAVLPPDPAVAAVLLPRLAERAPAAAIAPPRAHDPGGIAQPRAPPAFV
jgi:hypothetical protein